MFSVREFLPYILTLNEKSIKYLAKKQTVAHRFILLFRLKVDVLKTLLQINFGMEIVYFTQPDYAKRDAFISFSFILGCESLLSICKNMKKNQCWFLVLLNFSFGHIQISKQEQILPLPLFWKHILFYVPFFQMKSLSGILKEREKEVNKK